MTDGPLGVNSIVTSRDLGQTAPMKILFRLIVLFAPLAACSSLSIYYREGASVSRMQSDTIDCQVAALKDAPVANQVRQSPPIFFPGRTVCNSAGQCYQTPGYWEPGRIYTVDANEGLRNQVEAQCMARRGYRPVTLEPCKQNVKSQVPQQRTDKLPPLSSASCFVKFEDGTFQIITPSIASKQG